MLIRLGRGLLHLGRQRFDLLPKAITRFFKIAQHALRLFKLDFFKPLTVRLVLVVQLLLLLKQSVRRLFSNPLGQQNVLKDAKWNLLGRLESELSSRKCLLTSL